MEEITNNIPEQAVETANTEAVAPWRPRPV